MMPVLSYFPKKLSSSIPAPSRPIPSPTGCVSGGSPAKWPCAALRQRGPTFEPRGGRCGHGEQHSHCSPLARWEGLGEGQLYSLRQVWGMSFWIVWDSSSQVAIQSKNLPCLYIYIYRYIGSLFCICGNWTSCWPCVAEWHLLVRNFEKWNSAIKTYSEPSLLFNVHGWLFKANPLGDQEQLIRAEVLRMMMLTL